jgi:predicted RNA binding protein YcfA (HicA-like mRNA interferase family)
MYGRSIGVRAPGNFMSALTRKAARAGGQRQVIDVRRLKTSQYDHSTGTFTKKSLAERWHVFGDGGGRVQRDVYSAFLARNSEENTYQPLTLQRAWQDVASVLQQAGWYEPKQRGTDLVSVRPGFAVRQSCSPVISALEQQRHASAGLSNAVALTGLVVPRALSGTLPVHGEEDVRAGT